MTLLRNATVYTVIIESLMNNKHKCSFLCDSATIENNAKKLEVTIEQNII